MYIYTHTYVYIINRFITQIKEHEYLLTFRKSTHLDATLNNDDKPKYVKKVSANIMKIVKTMYFEKILKGSRNLYTRNNFCRRIGISSFKI